MRRRRESTTTGSHQRSSWTQEELDVEMDKALVVKEFAFADEFTIDDLRVYSRMEIIENMQN